LALPNSSGVSSVFSSSPMACQPASLYLPVTGSGKIVSATGPNPENRESASFSSLSGGRRSVSMRLSVRMAAMMSRALAFSPLATWDAVAGDGCSERAVGGSGELIPSAAMDVAVSGGCGVSFGRSGSAAGFVGGESKSDGWFCDAFSRATYDG
jgi:hypothetical protein